MLLNKLIIQGYYVAIESGLLVIKSATGTQAPKGWLQSKSEELVKQILDLTGCPAYHFTHHTTGIGSEFKSDRLTLWFYSVHHELEVLAHFNVDIKRKRNITGKKAGSKLPARKFTPKPNSKFIRWWRSLNLPTPRYPSEYHEKLHLLKPLLLTGATYLPRKGEVRFQDKKNIELLSIDYELIKSSVNHRELAGKPPVTRRELVGKNDREETPPKPRNTRATDKSDYVSDLVRLKNSVISTTNKAPHEQTTDEWLVDYE